MKMHPSEPTDSELLADWSSRQREPAFRQLVARYAGLVHMAAKRTCGDDSMAAEASQLTFILLAQKGKSLTSRKSIAGWLHLTAVMQAKNLRRKSRGEIRKREQLHAAMDANPPSSEDETWKEMQPVLDDALAALSEKDREALLLHFYRSLDAREIAETLGIATAAARKRIDRATERLRAKLAVRGCKVGTSLGTVILAGFATDAKASGLSVSLISAKATSVAAAPLYASIPIAMKASALVPPAVALVIASMWIVPQRQAIAGIERRNALAASSGETVANNSGPAIRNAGNRQNPAANPQRRSKGIDWEAIAIQQEDERIAGRVWNVTGLPGKLLEDRLEAMSVEELDAELDRIAALDVPAMSKISLQSRIGYIIARKDPAFALEHLEGGLSEKYGLRFVLADALKRFAKDHPDEAATWLDRQIQSGRLDVRRLDGRNWARDHFQSVLISNLLVSDTEAAGQRLAAMPLGERIAVLGYMNRINNGDEQIAYAKVVRENLPAKNQLNLLGLVAWNLQANLSNVDAYLNRIEATPEERGHAVKQAGIGKIYITSINRKLTVAELTPTLRWLEKNSPESADRILGEALGKAAGSETHSNLREISSIVLHFHDSRKNDDLMEAFLNSEGARKQPKLARLMATKIIDGKRRDEVAKTFE